MAEIDVLKAQLVRTATSHPWGFRLCGGAELGTCISIESVRPGSPAHKIGLKAGDEVTEIGDTPTANLTSYAANSLILEYGLSLILTLERRARGAIPNNPVISHPAPVQHAKHYQPYDMSGKSPAPRHPPPAPAAQYDFQTAQSRPYDQTPGQRGQPQRAQAPQASYQPTPQYDVHDEPDLGGVQQSRTFKMLASLMQNEEPHSGSSGLPPPRSHATEQRKAAEAAAKQNPSRVKVFMPQQYNTPLGMYSAENVVDSFQQQAEVQLGGGVNGGPNGPGMSEAQRACIEQDNTTRNHQQEAVAPYGTDF